MGLFSSKARTEEEIKSDVIKRLNKQGISYSEEILSGIHYNNVTPKSMYEIKKRAMASMLSIQLACSIRNGESYLDSLTFVVLKAKEWGLLIDDFLPKERILLNNKFTQENNDKVFTQQDIIEIVWTYESYWALLWYLDSITDKELYNASKVCNTERAMAISVYLKDYTESIRSMDKLQEQLYLFYCYQWAFGEKENNPNISTGDLNLEVVLERRRGLEWIISDEKDWNNLVLATIQ